MLTPLLVPTASIIAPAVEGGLRREALPRGAAPDALLEDTVSTTARSSALPMLTALATHHPPFPVQAWLHRLPIQAHRLIACVHTGTVLVVVFAEFVI